MRDLSPAVGQMPAPCRRCPVRTRHNCQLQERCICSNAWYRARRDILLRRFLVFFPKTPTQSI